MAVARLCLAGLLAFAAVASHTCGAERPNIVLILSDDQAWTDYGFMGHPVIETPRLDELAAQSLVLERGYVAAPLCRPSLASIVTGRYPFDHGITGNDVGGKGDRAALDVPLRDAFHRHPSFIKQLVNAGYLAHQSGKWWEGSWRDGGFTHGMTHGDPARRGRHGDAGLAIGRQTMKPIADFLDIAIAEDKPFFVWYAPFLPHTPHNPPERLLAKCQSPDRSMDVAKYFAMCEWFDETCGELLDLVADRGVRDNTLVLYVCDNGWAAPSTNRDDPNQSLWDSYAMRSKSSPYENGIRTPILASWPGHVAPARIENELASAVDLFPTIAAAAGLQPPNDLPGINLLDDAARKHRDAIFGVCHASHNMTPHATDETLQYLWCVSGEWKLLVRHHGSDTTHYRKLHVWDKDPVRLYDLARDPHEQHNLAAEHPEMVEQLRRKIDRWHAVPST